MRTLERHLMAWDPCEGDLDEAPIDILHHSWNQRASDDLQTKERRW